MKAAHSVYRTALLSNTHSCTHSYWQIYQLIPLTLLISDVSFIVYNPCNVEVSTHPLYHDGGAYLPERCIALTVDNEIDCGRTVLIWSVITSWVNMYLSTEVLGLSWLLLYPQDEL